MDSVNNMAAAAAKAVWGNNKTTEEPVSGQQGDIAKGEPFDKGNIDEPATSTATDSSKSITDIPFTESTKPSGTTSDLEPISGSTTESSKPTTEHIDAEFAKNSGIAAESDQVPDNPSTDLKAKDTPADTTEGQNDVRDPEDPHTNPKNVPIDVDNTGDGPNEAQKLDAPGPKPLDAVARTHGGDAGKAAITERVADKPTADDEDEDDPGAKSNGEGTGELYVKSSGLKADGGDFDATKPGAGREADRLLEDKGIHQDKPAAAGSSDDTDDTAGNEKKKSPFAKIKEKLHKH